MIDREIDREIVDALGTLNTMVLLGSFDRMIYVDAYGENAVKKIEGACGKLSDVSLPNMTYQAVANMSYNKGVLDAYEILKEHLGSYVDEIKGGHTL